MIVVGFVVVGVCVVLILGGFWSFVLGVFGLDGGWRWILRFGLFWGFMCVNGGLVWCCWVWVVLRFNFCGWVLGLGGGWVVVG